jgi:hypothetical protein
MHASPTYEFIYDMRSRMPKYNITFALFTPVITHFLPAAEIYLNLSVKSVCDSNIK